MTYWNFDVMIALDEKLSWVITVHPKWSWLPVQNFMTIHPVVETFHSTTISWTTNANLLMARSSQGITKVIRIHPLATVAICARFHGCLSSSWNISGWTKVVDRHCHDISMTKKLTSFIPASENLTSWIHKILCGPVICRSTHISLDWICWRWGIL